MDDNNKILNQTVDPVAQVNSVQPQVPSQLAQPAVQPVQNPTGSVNKETGPVSAPLVSEFVKPTEVEPQISQDLKELGIEAKKDSPNVADEHKGIIEHAKQFTPVSAFPSGKITMPMTEEEVDKQLKTGQDDDSGKWLAGLIQKIIKAMGFIN